MEDTTKAKAQTKIDSFKVKIGNPDKWRDFSKIDLKSRPTYYQKLVALVLKIQLINLE